MASITPEALAERIDGLRRLTASLHDQRTAQINQILEKLNDINGRSRGNAEIITRNCTLLDSLEKRIDRAEEGTRASLNRRSIMLGITEIVLAAASWLSPKP